MPRASRSRLIEVDPGHVWDLVSDPHNLPRWWPRTRRVEDVRTASGGMLAWTSVLETERGASVRADFRCARLEPGVSIAWQQDVEGTPFERILRSSEVEVQLAPAANGTEVELAVDEILRGLSRLGSPMITGAAKRRLDEALEGIERALVEPAA